MKKVSVELYGELKISVENRTRYVTKKWLFDGIEWLFYRICGTHIDEKL